MAEKIAKLIYTLTSKDKGRPTSWHETLADHPLLHIHRTHVNPEKAQRLGQFALQFLH